MCSLLCSLPFVQFTCARIWGRGVLPAALPALFSATLSPALSVYLRECGAAGSASGQTACPVRPILHQSLSGHSNWSPLCLSPPLLPFWMNVYFLVSWCWTSLPFDFLSVLVVQGGAVCLLTPPSWFSSRHLDCSPLRLVSGSDFQNGKSLNLFHLYPTVVICDSSNKYGILMLLKKKHRQGNGILSFQLIHLAFLG